MIAYRIDLEDDEAFVQQVDPLIRVEQEVVLATPVERLQHIEKTIHIEVFLAVFLFAEHLAVVALYILIKSVERRLDIPVLLDPFDIEADGIREGHLLGACGLLGIPFPEGHDQRFDRFLFLDVVLVIFGEKGIERYGILLGVGLVDAVLAACHLTDQRAEALIRITRIDQQDVCSLLPILAQHMVHEERFSGARTTQDEFVPVSRNTFFHRQVRDIQMQRFSADAVGHFDSERRERIPVVGLFDKETESLFDKGVERLLGGEIALASGNSCPEQCRYVDSVVPGLAAHQRQSRSCVVFDGFQLFAVFAPCHHVDMAAYGGQSERMRLIEIGIDPLLVDLVGAAVAGERMEVAGQLLEPLE